MTEHFDLQDFQSKVQRSLATILRLEGIEQRQQVLSARLQEIETRKHQLVEHKQIIEDNKRISEKMLLVLEQAQQEVEGRRQQLGVLTPKEMRELRQRMEARGLELELEEEEEE